jgi:hypothetical protein
MVVKLNYCKSNICINIAYEVIVLFKVKRAVYIFIFYVLTSCFVFSQNNEVYKTEMKKQVEAFHIIKTPKDFFKQANEFENIIEIEKKQWLPYYYASLCYALSAFEKQLSEIDLICNRAERLANIADSLKKNNSEISVVKSLIAAARIPVNEKLRGQKYGTKATKLAIEAVKYDSENPRAYFVKAKAILFTPKAIGGGAEKAKPFFELALEKFKNSKQTDILMPYWGKAETEKELKRINKK